MEDPLHPRAALRVAVPRLDIDHAPGRTPTLGEAPPQAHHLLVVAHAVDRDQDPRAHRPGALDTASTHRRADIQVDALGHRLESKLAQRGQVGGAEETVQGRARLLGHIDLALLEAVDQLARGQIHQHQIACLGDQGVGDGLAHPHAGDACDGVVEAFQMLDVDGGPDIDTVSEQLLDVLVATRVAGARDVAVREFVDQHHRRGTLQDRIQVQLLEDPAAIGDALPRDQLQSLGKGLGLRAPVALDQSDHHVHTLAPGLLSGLQHLERLAHAGGCAEEDLQPAATLLRDLREQCLADPDDSDPNPSLQPFTARARRARGSIAAH